MYSHSFNFIERCSCHWLLNVTLQLAPATAVLELIGQFFCSYTCWNFMSCLHCTQVWCPAVCAKLLNMMFKWIVDKTEVICWFCWLIFDFAMAEIYKCCWLWIQCLGHVNIENAFDAHFIHQYIAYICMHCWALSKVSIKILLCHSFRSAREDTNQSLSLTERSRVSVGILRQHFCEPFLRGGVCATFLPNDAAAAACRRRRRRRRRRSCVGGDVRVFPACTRTSACWLLQCCAAWYVNAHLIPAISTDPHMPRHWHGVCRPKQYPITFPDRTTGCFGWNSSPSQCCASRSVLEHHISAIDVLYQPITLIGKIQ